MNFSTWNEKPVINDAALNNEMLEKILHLLATAHTTKNNAYAPYSRFQVGAALLANNGEVITGVNVENASYGLTICAERTALFKAVSQGYRPGDFTAIAVAASADGSTPCGACREVINEFGPKMVIAFEFDGKVVVTTLSKLLPFNFRLETSLGE